MSRSDRTLLTWTLLALFSLGSAAAAQAQLFGVDGSGGGAGSPFPRSTLYEIDPTDGALLATIEPAVGVGTGFSHITAIDFDPISGLLYGIANGAGVDDGFGVAFSTLITIDSTGAGAFVADITGMTPCVDYKRPRHVV